jgi:hypothetical protein
MKEVVKEAYESPWIEVRSVCLEGVIAESFEPVIETGEVKYNEYETVSGTQDSDVLIL